MKPRQYKFNNSTLTIKFGNLLDSQADVIVSSDDSHITMGGGVSRALLNQGGEEIQADAVKKTPAELGGVVVTTAGRLEHQKFIFHAITIDYDFARTHYLSTKEDFYDCLAKELKIERQDICSYIVRNSVNRCFRLMNALELDSIAFPTIGAGTAGLPIDKVAQNMADEISANLMKTNREINVELYLFDTFHPKPVEYYLDMFEYFAVQSAVAQQKVNDQSADGKTDEEVRASAEELNLTNPEKSDYDVFISYSRKDGEKADEICNLLDQAGITYWIDRHGYYSGSNYVKVIINAIKKAKVVMFLSSESSNISTNVQKEIREALSRDKKLIPVKIDKSQYSDVINFDIRDLDYIEYDGSAENNARICNNIRISIGISEINKD